MFQVRLYSTFQVGCLRKIGSSGEIGVRSIDVKITQTTNPIVNPTKTIGLWLMLFLKYLPIALFLSNNHPEMYCSSQVGWKSASCKLQSLSKQYTIIEPLFSYHNDSSLNGTVLFSLQLALFLPTCKLQYSTCRLHYSCHTVRE